MSTIDSQRIPQRRCTTQIKPELASRAFRRSKPVAALHIQPTAQVGKLLPPTLLGRPSSGVGISEASCASSARSVNAKQTDPLPNRG